MANKWGNSGNSESFFGLQNHCRWWLQPWNEKVLARWKRCYEQPRQPIENQGHDFVEKGPASHSYGFSSNHVWIWELDYRKSWALKNWCFWTVMLEKTLESPLDCKEIQPVNPKRNQSWIFIRRTHAEAEAPILWPRDVNWLIWKEPDAGEDWRQEEKGTTEDEMVGWHYRLDGHELEQAPGVGDGQVSLVCCSPWGCKESDKPERLNWTEPNENKQSFSPLLVSIIYQKMRAFIILVVFSFLSSKILSSNIIFYRFPDNTVEKAMALHSITLAWKIP